MKTLYLYWGGRPLSYLRFLTVKSFRKHNPEWKIEVYYPVSPVEATTWTTQEQRAPYDGEDWFSKLDAELKPFNMESIGCSNALPEVHKSDIFRLWVLHEYGGVYSDFDILYTKPFPDFPKRLYCLHPDGHYAVGLLGAERGDPIFKRLLESAKKLDAAKYQSYGATLWNKELQVAPSGWNIPKELVYPCDWQDAQKLFTESLDLPDETIGLHWFGGVGEQDINTGSTIDNIVKELA